MCSDDSVDALDVVDLLGDTAYNTGWLKLYGEDPSDFTGANLAFDESAQLSRSVGSHSNEDAPLARLGMIALLGGTALATHCRLALDVGYDIRDWSVVRLVAGVLAPWLVVQHRFPRRRGRTATASPTARFSARIYLEIG